MGVEYDPLFDFGKECLRPIDRQLNSAGAS